MSEIRRTLTGINTESVPPKVWLRGGRKKGYFVPRSALDDVALGDVVDVDFKEWGDGSRSLVALNGIGNAHYMARRYGTEADDE